MFGRRRQAGRAAAVAVLATAAILAAAVVVGGAILLPGRAAGEQVAAQVIWHNMPILALQNGHYQAAVTVGEAKRHGELGVGAMADLDGEVIFLDGKLYRYGQDGSVAEQPDSARLAFAGVSGFTALPKPMPLPAGTTFADLLKVVDPTLPTVNAFYVVRVRGRFATVSARTFPRQVQPFPPLCAVKPVIFPLQDVEGTMVGFRSPQFASTLTTPAYHLHFLSADHGRGGHVLDFKVASASIEVQRINGFTFDLPTDEAFDRMNLSAPIVCK